MTTTYCSCVPSQMGSSRSARCLSQSLRIQSLWTLSGGTSLPDLSWFVLLAWAFFIFMMLLTKTFSTGTRFLVWLSKLFFFLVLSYNKDLRGIAGDGRKRPMVARLIKSKPEGLAPRPKRHHLQAQPTDDSSRPLSFGGGFGRGLAQPKVAACCCWCQQTFPLFL